MAFSQSIKEEMLRVILQSDPCEAASFASGLALAGHFEAADTHMVTSFESYARYLAARFGEIGGYPATLERNRGRWKVSITDAGGRKRLLSWMEALGFGVDTRSLPDDIWSTDMCRRAALRGFFLAGGSVGDPSHGYHLEFTSRFIAPILLLERLLKDEEIHPHRTDRSSLRVLYMKDGSQISDFLLVTGAHSGLLSFESMRVEKDMRNTVTRMVNCDTANSSRVAMAAARQLELLRSLSENTGLGTLPMRLREAAEARLAHPEWSILELGESMDPPLGKSGMSHRLRRLEKLAEEKLSLVDTDE